MNLNKVFCLKINQFEFESKTTIAKLDFKLIKVGKNTDGTMIWKDVDAESFKDFQNILPDISIEKEVGIVKGKCN